MQNNSVRVSVVMPVYNVAEYVQRAVESVLKQDMPDFELICVDDGSTDGSGELLEALAKTDARMKVIRQKNGGAACARNAGMDIARGEYLFFHDSDDWAESDLLRRMVQRADDTQADLVVAGYYIETYTDAEHFTQRLMNLPEAVLDRADFRSRAYEYFDGDLLYQPWNKLYRADVMRRHGVRFPDVSMEDFPFNLDYIRIVDRVAVMSEAFYHFQRARANSLSQRYIPDLFDKREQEHEMLLGLFSAWRVDSPGQREFLARRYVERLIGCFENVTNPTCPLRRGEKYRAIAGMLHSPHLKQSLREAKPRSAVMKVMLLPVRMRCAAWAYLQSCFISYVRIHNVALFARLKANR